MNSNEGTMSGVDLAAVAAELRELRRAVEQVNSRLETLTTEAKSVVTLGEAAKRLSIGLTKARQLVADGALLTVEIGKRQMVPVSEIARVSTPTPKPVKGARVPRAKASPTPRLDTSAWLRAENAKRRQ